jgi:DNA-directed RNA polymerase specialized sigma subunit
MEDKLAELEAQATKITPMITGMPRGGGAQDKISEVVGQIVELQKEINYKLKKAHIIEVEIDSSMKLLEQNEAYIIKHRYSELKSWKQISQELGISNRMVYYIHDNILKKIG